MRSTSPTPGLAARPRCWNRSTSPTRPMMVRLTPRVTEASPPAEETSSTRASMFAVVASGAMTMTMWAVPVRCVRYEPRTSVPGTTKSPGPVCPGLLRKSSVSAQRVTGDRPGVGPVAIKAPKVSLHASTITHSSPDGTTAGEGDLSLAVFDREYRHKHRVLRRRSGDSHLDLGAFLGCGDDLDGAAQI